jgi:hypothetical protein
MLEVQKQSLDRAIKLLTSLAANNDIRWAISVGEEAYGNSGLAITKPAKSRGGLYKRGETRDHYYPYLKDLQPGETAEIPFDRFDPATLSANVGSAAGVMFGAGNYVTCRVDTKQVIQVLRIV